MTEKSLAVKVFITKCVALLLRRSLRRFEGRDLNVAIPRTKDSQSEGKLKAMIKTRANVLNFAIMTIFLKKSRNYFAYYFLSDYNCRMRLFSIMRANLLFICSIPPYFVAAKLASTSKLLGFAVNPNSQAYAESVWRQKHVSYFAYGSNMNPAVLEDMRGIKPLDSCPGFVRGYKLAFNLRGPPLIAPSSASAEPSEGEELHGVLFTLSRSVDALLYIIADWASLISRGCLVLITQHSMHCSPQFATRLSAATPKAPQQRLRALACSLRGMARRGAAGATGRGLPCRRRWASPTTSSPSWSVQSPTRKRPGSLLGHRLGKDSESRSNTDADAASDAGPDTEMKIGAPPTDSDPRGVVIRPRFSHSSVT